MRLLLLLAALGLAARVLGAAEALPPDLADLQRRIDAAPASERSALLTKMADGLEAVDPLRGITPARQAVELATSPREKLAAEAVLATLLRYQTDYSASLVLVRAGLDQAIALGDKGLQARFDYELGRLAWNQADHPEALTRFHEAIRLAEQLGDAKLLAEAHLGSVALWEDFDEHEQALAHLELARKYAETAGDARLLAAYYRALGNYRTNAKDLAGGRLAHERSREISARAGQARGVADALQNLAAISALEGHLDEARVMVRQAIAIYERLGLKRYLASSYRELGGVLAQQRHYAEALDCLNRSLALAESFGVRSTIANVYRQLAAVQAAAGNQVKAAEYRRKLEAETEVMFGERARQKVALLDAQFKIERNEHQMELLRRDQAVKEAELKGARAYRYALLAVIAFLVIAGAAVVSRQRIKLAAERRVLVETHAARQAAEEASQLKSRLLGIASHDLKSPLAAFVGCAKEIERAPEHAARAAELAARMRTHGEQMLALVHELLDASAIESGRLSLNRVPCDLAAIVRGRVEACRNAVAAKGQTLVWTDSGGEPVTVFADAARLAQVFDNLIGNAIKFTPRGRSIHIRVETLEGRAAAHVRDSGPGLQPEDFARLFQPFQALSAQPTEGESSSGLGLFIAREITALHGGRLGVDSMPGEGATFSVVLPRSDAAAGARA